MKRLFLIPGAASAMLISCRSQKPAPPAEIPRIIKAENLQRKTTRTLIIFYDKEIGNADLMKAVREQNASLVYEYKNLHGIAIKIAEGKSVEQAITFFRKVRGVVSVHRDQIHSINPPPQI